MPARERRWEKALWALAAGACCCPGGRAAGATGPYDPEVRVESAWLYGNVNKYAYYFAELLVGSPEPQRTSVIVDTGSHLIGFPCKGCEHCGEHIDPAFDFSRSTSARWLNCSEHCASDCVGGQCPYKELYTEGSSVSGFWFNDLVRLGEGPEENPPVRARLGCHRRENRLFYEQRADGIMGLAPAGKGGNGERRSTILEDLFKDKQHVNASVFSLCLATWGGKLTVGGYEAAYHISGSSGKEDAGRGIQWLSLTPQNYYFVFPSALMIGSIVIAAGVAAFGAAIIDSGTTFSSFPGPVFRNLVNDLNTHCSLNSGCGAKREGDTCWRVNSLLSGPKDFPTLSMYFDHGGVKIDWPPHAYLHQSAEPGVWCRGFKEGSAYTTVLGISWMLHKDVIFDIQQGRLGVADAFCPEHGRPADLIEAASMDVAMEDIAAASRPSATEGDGRPGLLAAAAAGSLLLLLLAAGAVTVRWSRRRLRRALSESALWDVDICHLELDG